MSEFDPTAFSPKELAKIYELQEAFVPPEPARHPLINGGLETIIFVADLNEKAQEQGNATGFTLVPELSLEQQLEQRQKNIEPNPFGGFYEP